MKKTTFLSVLIFIVSLSLVITDTQGQTNTSLTGLNSKSASGVLNLSKNIKGENTIFFSDDFDSFTVGEQLACQNPENWTTWNNAPCTSTDAYVVDTYSYSSPNSVNISDGNSLVNKFGTAGHGFHSGKFKISFLVYIPNSQKASWKILYNYEFNASTAMEVIFEDGTGHLITEGNTDLANFYYSFNTWIPVEISVSLEDDVAKLIVNDNIISSWKWTGNGNPDRLSAINFKGNLSAGNCNYFIDDFKLEKHKFPFPETMAPTNLTAEFYDVDKLIVDWDYFGPGSSFWIEWDSGENGNDGIGLTGGGTFYCASRWEPADLTLYDGMYLTRIKYFHYEDAATATFVLKVWKGPNADTLLLSQEVNGSIPGEWNNIALATPVQIDATQQLWFGYEVTHVDGENPAGVDSGPAIQYKGDMLSFDDASWVSISAEYGLDYNWNIAAEVTPVKNLTVSIPMIKTPKNPTEDISTGITNDAYYVPPSYYNIYFSYDGGDYFLLDTVSAPPFIYEDIVYAQVYCFKATAVYENYFESEPSNEDCEIIVNKDNTQSIESRSNFETNVIIFPNPATDVVNIKSDVQLNSVKVYNYAGQVIVSEDVNAMKHHLNTSQYQPGIYFFRIETDEGTILKRIVIE